VQSIVGYAVRNLGGEKVAVITHKKKRLADLQAENLKKKGFQNIKVGKIKDGYSVYHYRKK